jgi:hypothetical protein
MGYQVSMGKTCHKGEWQDAPCEVQDFALKLKTRKSWCQSWMGAISTIEKESVCAPNLNRKYVNITLVMIANMQKMIIFMELYGLIMGLTKC